MFKRLRNGLIGLLGLLSVFNVSVFADTDIGLLAPEKLSAGTIFPVIITTSEELELQSLECHIAYEPDIMKLLSVEVGGEPARYSDIDGFVTIIQYNLNVHMKDPVLLTFQVRPEVPAFTQYYFRLTDRFIGKTAAGTIDRAVENGAGGMITDQAETQPNSKTQEDDFPRLNTSELYEQSRVNAEHEKSTIAQGNFETTAGVTQPGTTEPMLSESADKTVQTNRTTETTRTDKVLPASAEAEVGPAPEDFHPEAAAENSDDLMVNSGMKAAWLVLAILVCGAIVYIPARKDKTESEKAEAATETSLIARRKKTTESDPKAFLFEFIRYMISGVIVTLANILVFDRLVNAFGISYWFISNIVAIVCSIILAYTINRTFVFRSRAPIIKEFIRFFFGRLFISLLFEQLAMYIMFQLLNFTAVWNIFGVKLYIAKLLSQLFVVIGNFIMGKKLVFK